jgi:RNA polymerase sigma-70 factor (ECF subfamily)
MMEPRLPPIAESRLLELAKAGDQEAFTRALGPHLPMLYAYSRSLSADHHSAQDIVQQTALIAYRKLGFLFPEVDFACWLKGIARREALSERRKTARLRPVAEEILEAAYDDPTPEAVGAEREALAECLKRLRGRTAAILTAHYFLGQKLTEIARQMGLNGNTVRTLLHRARLSLEGCVRDRLAVEKS